MFALRNIIVDDDVSYIEEEEEEEEEAEKVTPVFKMPQKKKVSPKSTYDLNIIEDIMKHSKRFYNLKSDIVLELLEGQPKFDYLKKYALLRLESNFMRKLTIFDKMMDYSEKNYLSNDELSHGIFSWYWDDFQKRRKITNFVWVDVLLRTAEDSLHMYKFQQDLKQLKDYIKKIFDFLYLNIEDKEFDLYTHIEKPLLDIKKVLRTTESVEEELRKNSSKLKQFLHKEHFVESARRDTEEKFLKHFLESRIWNSHIWDPITIRYNLNWCRNLIDQNQFRLNNIMERKLNEINKYKTKSQMETFIDGNCMDFFYATIEIYKGRLEEMEEKYERQMEIVDNKLIYTRVQIEKLKDQRKSLQEDIERFHIEEDKMREQIAKEEEEKRLKEELEAEKAALEAMKRKSRKSAAKSKDSKGKAVTPKDLKGKAAVPKQVKGKAAMPKQVKSKAANPKELKGKPAMPKGAGKKKGK